MKILIPLVLLVAAAAAHTIYTHDVINAHFKVKTGVKTDKNLVEKATELGLNTLLEYATDAGLADTLAHGGPFTNFAPTDDAFGDLPEEVRNYLTQNVTALAEVLSYHLYDGNFASSMIKNELTIPSKLKGAMIRFNTYTDLNVVTATGSPVINADQMATNGIIHVIDRVMVPIPVDDIVGVVSKCPVFSTLLKAVSVAGLADALKGDGLTLMAPTDDAFAKIPESDLADLFANKTALTDVLTYHVVAGTLYSAGLSNNDSVKTLEGKSFKITITDADAGVKVNDATVTYADGATTNGVIHVIDTVLMPPGKK